MTNVTKIESLMEQYDDAMSNRDIPLCKLLKAEIEQLVTLDHAEALRMDDDFDGTIRDGLTTEQRAIHNSRMGIDIYGECFKARLESDHAEALKENYRFDWLANRFALFWDGCHFSTRRLMIGEARAEAQLMDEGVNEALLALSSSPLSAGWHIHSPTMKAQAIAIAHAVALQMDALLITDGGE